jgi:N,N'-diacetyllegionaminate synthase
LSPNNRVMLGNRRISAEEPTYIIAEIGVNHNGDVDLGHQLIDAARAAGADAAKFQTFQSSLLALETAGKAAYQERATGAGNQSEMLRKLQLPLEAFAEFRAHCSDVGLDFISSAFDDHSLDLIASLDPVCFKWPSGELNNLPLLRLAKTYALPILLSTGMASLTEVSAAIDELRDGPDFVVMQCVSNYPAPIEQQNLRAMPLMGAAFGCPVGFSDHTLGPYAALVARALGMSVLEKHFTLDRRMQGPDHAASMEPTEFSEMVELLRKVEKGLGDGIKRHEDGEADTRSVARKSLVYAADLPRGKLLTESDLVAKRPGTGVGPEKLDLVLGARLNRAVRKDELLDLADVR